jgi:hypothetical protein
LLILAVMDVHSSGVYFNFAYGWQIGKRPHSLLSFFFCVCVLFNDIFNMKPIMRQLLRSVIDWEGFRRIFSKPNRGTMSGTEESPKNFNQCPSRHFNRDLQYTECFTTLGHNCRR